MDDIESNAMDLLFYYLLFFNYNLFSQYFQVTLCNYSGF